VVRPGVTIAELPPAFRQSEHDVQPHRLTSNLEEHERPSRLEQLAHVADGYRNVWRGVHDVGCEDQIEASRWKAA
jgi:hypothetical protein